MSGKHESIFWMKNIFLAIIVALSGIALLPSESCAQLSEDAEKRMIQSCALKALRSSEEFSEILDRYEGRSDCRSLCLSMQAMANDRLQKEDNLTCFENIIPFSSNPSYLWGITKRLSDDLVQSKIRVNEVQYSTGQLCGCSLTRD